MSSDDRSRRPNEPEPGGDPASPSDFGSFVSSSVRDSFRKLKPAQQPATPEPPPDLPPATRQPRRRRNSGESRDTSPEIEPSPTLGAPVGRKWRDALPGSSFRHRDTPEEAELQVDSGSGDEYDATADGEGGNFDAGRWFRDTFYDDDRPNRKFWALIAALILIILLVIYFLNQGGDDNGGETPTPTSTTVISTDHTATPSRITIPSATKTVTVVVREPQRTPEPSPTPPVNVGGDNTRG